MDWWRKKAIFYTLVILVLAKYFMFSHIITYSGLLQNNIAESLIPLYSQDLTTSAPLSWEQEQDARKARVAAVCDKYREETALPVNYDRFYYSPEYRLMMCSTAKAGSTTFFLTTFTQILEGENFKPVVEPPGGQILSSLLFEDLYWLQFTSNIPDCVLIFHYLLQYPSSC